MKRRFVVSLDISTKDAEKQIKSTVGNLKTILADMGKASSKMGYFKELADYLAQVDSEIDRFKQKHGENLFNKVFGGLDSNLRAEIEKTFGTAKSQMDQLEQIRSRIAKIGGMGDTDEARAEMKALEQDARDLFVALGKADDIKLSGRGKLETRLQNMETALDKFALVWDGVNDKIKQGFSFDGSGGGAGGAAGVVEGITKEVQEEVEKLKKQKKEYEDIVRTLSSGGQANTTLPKKTSDQISHLKSLKDAFESARMAKERLEATKMTGGNEYLEAVANYTQAAAQLKAGLEHDNLTDGAMDWVNENALDLLDDVDRALDNILNKQKNLVASIQNLYSGKISSIDNEMLSLSGGDADTNELVSHYDTLKKKVQEYYEVLYLRDRHEVGSPEYDKLDEQLGDIVSAVEKIKQLDKDSKGELIDVFGDIEYGEIRNIENALTRICDILQIEIPLATSQAEGSINGSTGGIASSADDTAQKIEAAKAKVKEFNAIIDEMNSKSFEFSAEDNVEIGQYTEKLNVAKRELDELGEQGLISAAELEQVNAAFLAAKDFLDGHTVHYTGYGSGGGYTYSWLEDYETERQRADMLEEEVGQLREELNSRAGVSAGSGSNTISDLEYTLALAGQLKDMFATMSRRTNLEYNISINGLDIKALSAKSGEVGPSTQMASYIDNLFSSFAVYGHSHQGGSKAFNVDDIVNSLNEYYNGLKTLSFVVGGDGIQTLDLSGINIEDIDKLKDAFLGLGDNHRVPLLVDNVNKIVEKITGVKNVLRDWDPSNVDELAQYMYNVAKNATSTLAPLEKVQVILDHFFGKGKVDASKYGDLLSTLNQDNARDIFNQIAEKENLPQLDESLPLTMGQVNNAIDATIDSYKRLREEANLTYEEIKNEVSKYISHLQNGGGVNSNLDFFKTYFPDGEWQEVRGLLADAYDNLISVEEVQNRIADKFGIDPDTFAKIPTGQTVDGGNAGVNDVELANLAELERVVNSIADAVERKNRLFGEESDIVKSATESEIESLVRLKEALDDVLEQLNAINGAFVVAGQNADALSQKDIDEDNADNNNEPNQDSNGSSLETTPPENGYALNTTLLDTNEILSNILSKIADGSSFSELIDPLKAAAEELKKVASGIKDGGGAQGSGGDDIGSGSRGPVKTPFNTQLSNATSAFNKYRTDAAASIYITEDFTDRLNNLAISLQSIGDESGLQDWMADFNKLQSDFAAWEKLGKENSKRQLTGFANSLNNEMKTLNFSVYDENLTDEQDAIRQVYLDAIRLINEQKLAVQNGEQVQINAINDKFAALKRATHEYKIQNKILNTQGKSGQKYGATAIQNATGRYNTLKVKALGDDFKDSVVVQKALRDLTASYDALVDKRKELAALDHVDDEKDAEFKQLSKEYSAYAKVLDDIIKKTQKLRSQSANNEAYMLGSDFSDTDVGRKAALEDFVQQIYGADVAIEQFKNGYNECVFAVDNGDGTFTQMTAKFTAARNEIVALAGDTKKATTFIGALWDEMKGKFRTIFTYLTASFGWQEIFQQVRKGVQYVREIDSALTELKKVTDETDVAYAQFLQDMSKTGSVVGATVADLTTMASEWARLGYSMEEAGKLAESTAILLNVSEFTDATQASEALISTMQAFQYTADESQHVVDILNEVGNNYAVSSDGIATALQDSASALMEGGNSLEQAVALVASANKVVQDPNSVGSALRTISLRLRGTSVEILEEMGEETDGVVESTSKLQEKLKALTGVDIVDMNGAYKDTYTILKEIGAVWKELDPMDQAAALELMAGKNRANTLAAILNNMEDLRGAYDDALNAEGSALKENKAYLDSIQGRVDLFNNSVQTMWMNFIDSDAAKTIVDIGNGLIKIVDNIGLITTALIGVMTYVTLIKKENFGKWLTGNLPIKGNKLKLLEGTKLDDNIAEFNEVLAKKSPEAFANYKAAAKSAGNGMDILAGKIENGTIQLKDGKVTTEDYVVALQEHSDAAQKSARAEQKRNLIINAVATAVAGVISAIKAYVDGLKTIEERYEELQSNISNIESDLSELDSKLQTINEQIDALSNKNLTIAEAEELRILKEQSKELERQKKLREDTLKTFQVQEEQTTLKSIDNLIKTTKAGQQQAKETGKLIGQIVGFLVDAALVIGGAVVTGASFGGATPLGAAMIGAGAAGTGSKLGEWIGGSVSGINSADSLTEWYDSYVEKIAAAEQKASEAEQKYLSTLSDKNYDKWQKKLDGVNTLKEDLYNNLTEMQGYIDNLEYNDQTKSTIDEFNKLMAHIDVTSTKGNIDAQISSIEALQNEYDKLSRGVDEHGNNIALTAEEYARYQAIISQVLGYNAGLTQSFDENGGAIYNAKGELIGYNALLAETIELLKEQKKQAAIDATSDESIATAVNNAKKYFSKNTWKKTYDERFDIEAKQWDSERGAYDIYNGAVADTAVSKAIGIDIDGSSEAFWIDNIDTIAENRDKINKQIVEDMISRGWDEASANEYLKQYNAWLDKAIDYYINGREKADQEIRNLLYAVPQTHDFYGDLSGSQLDFVNQYIDSFKNLHAKSDKEIKEIKNNILSLIDSIGDNEDLQNSINDLISLDPSSMPVDAYEKKFNELWGEISPSIPEEQRAQLLNQLFPDQSQVEDMMNGVKAKLESSSRGLAGSLSLEELRIAFRDIIPNLDKEISFEELKAKIAELRTEIDGPIVETFSTLKEQVASFNDVEKQTEEIILNNTKVTQEYKDSLVALGISETELAECFDATNSLVVTNTDKLNQLVKSAKRGTAQNISLAKSQARLQYYELYKEMSGYINAEGKLVGATKQEIVALYQKMGALEKTIAQYSRLETQLLGVANAYEKFAQAQEMDSESDYISSAEEMVVSLGKAINTAELGTESAKASIAGLVPKSVYEDLDTVDEKMSAIYDYFKNGKIAQYFSLEFDDDGNISSAEMKLGNMRKFIEDGLWGDNNKDGINVFEGTDWQHFEFSDKFLEGLEKSDDKLQYFADQMGVTKEVAFAFVESINDHDIEWLNGDYSSLFDVLTPESLENSIYSTTQAMADLNMQLINGDIDAKQYGQSMSELSKQEQELANKARSNAASWYEKTAKLEEYKEQLVEYNKQLESGKDSDGNVIDAEAVRKNVEKVTGNINTLTKELAGLEEPTELTLQVAFDEVQDDIDKLKKELEADKVDLENAIEIDAEGTFTVKTGFEGNQKLEDYVKLLNERHTLEVNMGADTPDVLGTLQKVSDTLTNIQKLFEAKYNLQVDTTGAVSEVQTFKSAWDAISSKSVVLTAVTEGWKALFGNKAKVNGTANTNGTAHASGNWGLPTSEHDSLVGELGTELVVDPQSGRYYTVGENGAEFVDLPKGAIIFNHKQTESLLKNGYVTSRGKAYADGNAHVTMWPYGSSQTQWDGTGYSSWYDPTYDLNEALDGAAGSVNEFAETIDWIEMRMENLDKDLAIFNAQLENAGTPADQNAIIDNMIKVNESIYANALAGAEYYQNRANTYLEGLSADLVEAAKNGAIAITDFTKEQDEATVEAIQNYRDFTSKAKDLTTKSIETITEIRKLAVQKMDNAKQYGDVKAEVEASQTEKLQNAVDFDEARGIITDPNYYAAMMENSERTIAYLTEARNDMQKEFSDMLANGDLTNDDGTYNKLFYEKLNDLYQMDAAIDEANIELEEFQNSINDIYWEGFDQLINQFDYISEDAKSLIDLMSSSDMFNKPNNENGWGEEYVKWTKEGLATIGLHAQEMERAEERAKMYGISIDDLTAEYEAGHYSESEYLEKLNELTQGQYDAIQAAQDEKDAIVDMQKARIDEVKNGIEKQIKAYEELIDKRKEELSSEQDLYDFQKSTMDQQKNIANIERQLAALANDNSMSAIAKRKQLEAELAEAQYQLQDTYYNRSVEDKQTALDKELESFQAEKEAEMEQLDLWLTDVETVVAESIGIIRDNATGIYDTLNQKANEYNLTLNPAITTPWQNAQTAIGEYSTLFGDTASSTIGQLEAMRSKWQSIKEELAAANKEADKYYNKDAATASGPSVADINKENANYVTATKKTATTTTAASNNKTTNSSSNTTTTQSKAAPSVGGTVTVKKTATNFSSKSGNAKMASFVPGGSYTVYQVSGDQILIGRNGSYTGWVAKKDLVGYYAKGTTSLKKSGLINVDELGEELILGAHNGRLTYAEKGTGIIPADITSNLMSWGELNPQEMIDRSRPSVGISPDVHNTEINLSITYGDMVSIGEFHGDNLADLEKMVAKQFEKHTKDLNSALRRYSR